MEQVMNHAVSIKAVLCSVVLFSTVVNAQNNSNNLNIDTLKQARNEQTLSLTQALNYALTHEPWLKASGYQEDATIAQSIAAGTLPDPVLTVGLLNLPTNGYAFDQEGMTQLKVDLSQKFSRGNSLAARRSLSTSKSNCD
jgi:hypothetical protein